VTATMLVEIANLTVVYDSGFSVGPIELCVERGSWLGMIGPNGSGKTTLLRSIARLSPHRGEIVIDGRKAASLSRRELATRVAYVPQQPRIPLDMTVLDYVLLGRTAHISYFGKESAADKTISIEILARLALAEHAHRPLGTLSGGEVQRVTLARSLAQYAPLLLLDEPTAALDLSRQLDVLELVEELRGEYDLTVISAMHDLTLAGEFADRLLLLEQGQIVATGEPDAVLTEEILGRHYGRPVQILRSDDGQSVVVPRRQRRGAADASLRSRSSPAEWERS
jgi:iron complex transport system ATP-binding protein